MLSKLHAMSTMQQLLGKEAGELCIAGPIFKGFRRHVGQDGTTFVCKHVLACMTSVRSVADFSQAAKGCLAGWGCLNKSGALSLEANAAYACLLLLRKPMASAHGSRTAQADSSSVLGAESLHTSWGHAFQQQSCSACRQMTLARQPMGGF